MFTTFTALLAQLAFVTGLITGLGTTELNQPAQLAVIQPDVPSETVWGRRVEHDVFLVASATLEYRGRTVNAVQDDNGILHFKSPCKQDCAVNVAVQYTTVDYSNGNYHNSSTYLWTGKAGLIDGRIALIVHENGLEVR